MPKKARRRRNLWLARREFKLKKFQLRLLKKSRKKSEKIYCSGNGFISNEWSQIRANIFGKPLLVSSFLEPGILGSVFLAIGAKDNETMDFSKLNKLLNYS